MDDISAAAQDYLKAIYELTEKEGRATTSQIADHLDVRPASVTGMLQKMAATEPPLVRYKKHYGVTLTGDGRDAALEITRHHRLLELFLHEILGIPWDEVHVEAERLEHCISEKVERRMAKVLGDPQWDPHGDPIPSYDLELQPMTDFPLSELRGGQDAVIRRVNDNDAQLLRYLDGLNLRPQAHIRAIEYVPFDQTLRLRVEGQEGETVLGPAVTKEIYVELR